MEQSLVGKVALVTGGSRGIGRSIALAMNAAGAKVMVSSRKQADLDEVCEAAPSEVAAFAANAGDLDAAAACVDATLDRFGALDILVNNAATNPYLGPTLGISESQYDKTMEVNLRAPLFWSKIAYERAMKDGGGSILNISSIGGLLSEPALGAYNVSKAGLIHLTKSLALELAPSVRVNAIAPGLVKTDMARELWESNEAAMAEAIPMKRLGEPDDISSAALFLSGPAASWITGHTLVVDGGMLLGS